jgi:hypothetical protein
MAIQGGNFSHKSRYRLTLIAAKESTQHISGGFYDLLSVLVAIFHRILKGVNIGHLKIADIPGCYRSKKNAIDSLIIARP